MGACAFEAYNVPYQTHGIKQVDGDGAEVVYMDRDFLASIVKGVMQVISHPFLKRDVSTFLERCSAPQLYNIILNMLLRNRIMTQDITTSTKRDSYPAALHIV